MAITDILGIDITDLLPPEPQEKDIICTPAAAAVFLRDWADEVERVQGSRDDAVCRLVFDREPRGRSLRVLIYESVHDSQYMQRAFDTARERRGRED